MLPTARVVWGPSLLVALLVFGASPVAASDRTDEGAEPSPVLVLATAALVELPGARVAVPGVLSAAAQTRPLDGFAPQVDATGFEAPALRRSMYVSFGALQVLDGLSTRKALGAGAREANPAMAGIAKHSTALFAVKAGTAVATSYLVERIARKHPRRAVVVMLALNAGYAAIVAHNYRVANAR